MPVEALPGLKDFVKYDVRKQPDSGGIYQPPSFLRETVIIAKPEVLPVTTSVIVAESISTVISRTKFNGEVPSNLSNKLNHDSTASPTLSWSRDSKDLLSQRRVRKGRRRGRCPDCSTVYMLSVGHQCRMKNKDSRFDTLNFVTLKKVA